MLIIFFLVQAAHCVLIVTDYGADLALTSECYLLFVGLFFVFLYFECMCCLCSLRLISFSMIGQLFFFHFFSSSDLMLLVVLERERGREGESTC